MRRTMLNMTKRALVAIMCLALAFPAAGILAVGRAEANGGGKITFASSRDGNWEIYVMNADGSSQTRLTNNTADDDMPTVSPDGTQIAFTSMRDGTHEIYKMNADGTGQTRLTNNSSQDQHPAWSPDGYWIAFTAFRDSNAQIYIMYFNGSGQENISNNTWDDDQPAWSPDGAKIAFTSYRGNKSEIYVMDNDGSNQTNLTNNSYWDQDPAWSPDGTKIAFSSERDGNNEIYVMNADGSGQTNLSNNSASDLSPVWSPDGSKVAFTSNRDGTGRIYVMNADGSDQMNIAAGADPAWSVGSAPTTDPPTVTNSTGASDVAWTSARLNGEVTDTGGQDPTVYIYWGDNDGGEVAGNWDTYEDLGTKGAETFYADISGLTPDTTYYYRCFAHNLGGDDWADSTASFNTSSIGPPTVTNSTGVSDVTSTSARLNGEVTGTGGEDPAVYIYWGDNDGGEVAGNWDTYENLGIKGVVTFYADISSLTPDTTYFYRCWASNSGGDAWADSTASFNTTALPTGKIAFASNRDGDYEIYTMNADGSDPANLTNLPSFDDKSPAWSPDGAKIAFYSNRDGNDEIYVMNADGSGQTNRTNNAAGDYFPAWSPDSNYIAFQSNRDGNHEIYVMSADGSGQTNISNNPASDQDPIWSPDGLQNAFTSTRDSGNYEIYVMNADGSGQTNISNNAASDQFPAWSPDGAQIAFASNRDGNWEIYVMNADGSGQSRLTNNSASDNWPTWSPDGNYIAFASNRDGNDEIYIMNADGSGQTRLTNDSASDTQPSWSAGPPAIVPPTVTNSTGVSDVTWASARLNGEITDTGGEDSTVYIYWGDEDGGEVAGSWDTHEDLGTKGTETFYADISSLTPDTTYYYRCWAQNSGGEDWAASTATFDTTEPPAGKIAFNSSRDGNDEIYVMNADGSDQTRLTYNTAMDHYSAWSPDGNKIAFSSYRDGNWEIYVMDADGSNVTNLANNSASDYYPAWSPDGTKIAFHSSRDGNQEIYVMNADGSDQTNISTNSADDEWSAWSPDGTKIAFSSHRDGNEEIYVMNADGSDQTNISNYPSGNEQWPAWSAGPPSIVPPTVTNSTSASDVTWTTARLHGEVTSTGGEDPTVYIYWGDEDGGEVAGSWDTYEDLGTKGAETFYADVSSLTPETTYYYRCWAQNSAGDDWADSTESFVTTEAPTGKIAFNSHRDGNDEIYVMNADGSSQTRLTDDAEYDVQPAWSPDGTKIAFTSFRDSNDEIYVMNADGSDQTNISNNPENDYDPAWSPDGLKIAFTSQRDDFGEIYVMNATDGSGQTDLSNYLSHSDYYPTWSSDSNYIAFTSNRDGFPEIYVMNASDGSGQINISNNSASDYDSDWSPDGTKIAFVSDRDSGNWEIYVMNADGSGQTNISNNSAGDLCPAWSPDSSKIAFASNRDGNWEIYVMNADGSGQTRLTDNSADDMCPAWATGSMPPAGGSISGTVTDGTDPLVGATVLAFDYSAAPPMPADVLGTAVTVTGGVYTIPDLDTGLYRVRVQAAGSAGEWYSDSAPDIYCWEDATAVSVTAPGDTSGIDFALEPGATISGHVEGSGGIDVENAMIVVFDYSSLPDLVSYGAGWTDADGNYVTSGLPAGEYILLATGTIYDDEWWEDRASPDLADTVSITGTPPVDVIDIDFSLGLPTPTGKIAFSSGRSGNWEIWVMNADGSDPTNISNYPSFIDDHPAWSPNGRKIAFDSNRDGNTEIYVMNYDGSSQTRLTDNPAWDYYPTWSSDGSQIAFQSDRDGDEEIYVMNSDGSGLINLTDNTVPDKYPAWSPDGSQIAFQSYRDGSEDIYVMNATDGSGQTRLTDNPAWDYYPAWSPDGNKIAFYSERDGNTEIYVMNADGSGQTRLTDNTAIDAYPTWSPDGNYIAFMSTRDGNYEIHVMNATDGSGEENLTNNPAEDRFPAWSAGPAPGGSISGTVTDGTNPIGSATVLAFDYGSIPSPATICGVAMTDPADGSYTIPDLDTGLYRVRVEAAGSAGEWYNDSAPDIYCWEDATPVPVTAPDDTPGIDFALEPGATISGHVEGPGGIDVENAMIVAFDYSSLPDLVSYGAGWTDADGNYVTGGLPPGDYTVQVNAAGFAAEWYDDSHDMHLAEPVSIGDPPSDVTAIDFALVPGACITGNVSDGTDPISGASITVFQYLPEGIGGFYGWAYTDGSGDYVTTGLPAGQYRVRALADSYAAQWYEASYNEYEVTPVTLVPPDNTPDIDFALELGGSISGNISDGTDPVEGAEVEAFRNDPAAAPENNYPLSGSAMTDSSGNYVISSLPPGEYKVWVRAATFASEWYGETYNMNEATLVTVTPPGDTPNIDVALAPGGTISGHVSDGTNPVGGAKIDVFAYDSLSSDEWNYCGWGSTDFAGDYVTSGLPAGQYGVHVIAGGYAGHWYDGAYAESQAMPVTVTVPNDTPNIDFIVEPGATISGHVEGPGGIDIEGAYVIVLDRALLLSGGLAIYGQAWTDADGNYETADVVTGDYAVRAMAADCAAEWYDDTYNVFDSATVSMTDPPVAITDIDFVLDPGATISGTVYEEDGTTPIPGATVIAFDYASLPELVGYSLSFTDGLGDYVTNGLPGGMYVVQAIATGFAEQWWENQTSAADADPVSITGTPLVDVAGIDFSLEVPAPTGKIAFTSDRDGNNEIYIMNADGSDQTNLTNNSANDYVPAVSPNGSKIVFMSNRDGNFEIYVMNAVDGSGQTRLTDNPTWDGWPTWSPDGLQIAFVSARDGNDEIYIMNADGSGQTRLTDVLGSDQSPAWSPDGLKIAFTSTRDGGNYEIYVMNSDGSDQTRLTDDPGYDDSPAWSPGGSQIAFTSTRDGGDDEIYVMDSNGSDQTNITNYAGSDSDPVWSPDGNYIAFVSTRNGGSLGIYVMNADGSGQTGISDDPSWNDYTPSWAIGPAPGDADGNGEINVLDMTKVAREILLWDAETDGADCNQDGDINVLDMTCIARKILGLD